MDFSSLNRHCISPAAGEPFQVAADPAGAAWLGLRENI